MPDHPADPAARIRAAKLRTDTYDVCTDPDLVAEYERLVKARDAAEALDSDSLAGSATARFDAEIEALRQPICEATVTLKFTALPRPKFRALKDKHPPRKDGDGKLTHAQDVMGVNYETFFGDLLRVSIIEPELDAETLELLFDERLSDKQWEDVADVVWDLNRTTVDVPFSSAVSSTTPTS